MTNLSRSIHISPKIKVNTLTKSLTSCPSASEAQVRQGLDPAKISTSANVSSASQFKPTYDRTYFRNKTLDQYLTLYREFSSENFDYYEITDEKLCSLCKLGYGEEESIEGKYTFESYFIKCEQHEIEITA